MKRVLVVIVVIAAILAGGYWFMQNRERFFPKPEARKVAPQRWQVSTAGPPEPSNATPASEAANASGRPTPLRKTPRPSPTPPAIAPPVDESCVRTSSRTRETTWWPATCRATARKIRRAKGRFDLNVKSVNMRYGVDFPGMNVDPVDILGARETIFRHVLQEPVLKFLHESYTPVFLDRLDRNDPARRQMAVTRTPSARKC